MPGNRIKLSPRSSARLIWAAESPEAAAQFVPDVVKSGVTFDEAYGRLKEGRTYTAQPTDVGYTLVSTVTASNGGGSASVTTPPTAAVAGVGARGDGGDDEVRAGEGRPEPGDAAVHAPNVPEELRRNGAVFGSEVHRVSITVPEPR